MTTANRAQRRAKVSRIAKAAEPFEPRVIGQITMEESRQLKARTEVIEDAQRRQKLVNIEVQLLLNEASAFVTQVSNAHGNPPGGNCSVDSESGEVKLLSIAPQPVTELPAPAEVGEPVMDVVQE